MTRLNVARMRKYADQVSSPQAPPRLVAIGGSYLRVTGDRYTQFDPQAEATR